MNITRGTILAKVTNGSTTSSVANYVVKADIKDPITGNDIYKVLSFELSYSSYGNNTSATDNHRYEIPDRTLDRL